MADNLTLFKSGWGADYIPPGFSDLPTALRLHRILFRSKVEAALYTSQVLRGAIIGKTGKPPGLPGGGLPMFVSDAGYAFYNAAY